MVSTHKMGITGITGISGITGITRFSKIQNLAVYRATYASLGLLSISCWKNKEKQGSAQGSAQLYVDDDEGSAQFFGT